MQDGARLPQINPMERRRIMAALATQGPYTAAKLDAERIGNRLLDHVNFVIATARR